MTTAGGYNPFGLTYWDADAFGVDSSGGLDDNGALTINGLRPVINIKSDVTITGTGPMTDPYVVS